MAAWRTSKAEIEAIVEGRHGNPFALLGLHEQDSDWVARAFVPDAEVIEVASLSDDPLGQLELRHDGGFFEGKIAIKGRGP